MPGIYNLAWTLAWAISGRGDETLLDTFELERRHVGIAAAAQSVANLDGLFEVVAALGLTRRAVSQLPQWLSAIPRWMPQRPMRPLVRGLTALAYQRFRLAQSVARVGQRIRRRAAAAIAEQGTHYRNWGRHLGVRYRRGAVLDDGLAPPPDDPQCYMPRVRAGGRLPLSWLLNRDRRVSTLDMLSCDQLTLLVSAAGRSGWSVAVQGLPLSRCWSTTARATSSIRSRRCRSRCAGRSHRRPHRCSVAPGPTRDRGPAAGAIRCRCADIGLTKGSDGWMTRTRR